MGGMGDRRPASGSDPGAGARDVALLMVSAAWANRSSGVASRSGAGGFAAGGAICCRGDAAGDAGAGSGVTSTGPDDEVAADVLDAEPPEPLTGAGPEPPDLEPPPVAPPPPPDPPPGPRRLVGGGGTGGSSGAPTVPIAVLINRGMSIPVGPLTVAEASASVRVVVLTTSEAPSDDRTVRVSIEDNGSAAARTISGSIESTVEMMAASLNCR